LSQLSAFQRDQGISSEKMLPPGSLCPQDSS
jgi:hypothetical protein